MSWESQIFMLSHHTIAFKVSLVYVYCKHWPSANSKGSGFKDTGLIPEYAANLNVGLLSPSNFDTNFKRETIGKALDSTRGRVEEFHEKHGTEYLDERQEGIRSDLQAYVDDLNTETQALNTLDRAAGTVWAGSGFRRSNGFGMDWALISVPNWRPFLNKVWYMCSCCKVLSTMEGASLLIGTLVTYVRGAGRPSRLFSRNSALPGLGKG